MELVYLWVEEYKNIHKQGFNFSPRFKCHYDENINELTIDENKDYVSIFPENINVTAIVGENGSGKSSVLEFLLELFSEQFGRESRNRCLLLYLYKNIPRYYSYKVSSLNMNQLTINSLKIEEQSHLLLDMHYGHENLISLCINNEYSEVGSFESSQFFIENSKKKSKEINILIIENSLKLKNILTKIENYFIPTKINIKIKELEYLTSILYEDMEFYNYDARNRIGSLIEESKNTTLISKIDLIKKIFKIKRDEHNIDEPFSIITNVKSKFYFELRYQDFCKTIPMKIIKNTTKGHEHLIKFSEIDDEILNFLDSLPEDFDIELEDEKRKFSKLSFGERQLLIVMNNILKYVLLEKYFTFYQEDDKQFDYEHNINEIVIFIDEFELGLHPNWQKKFFYYFSEIFKFTKKKIHLIITSHSPFLVSDIPKENVIFLEKGKQVYPFGDNQQTFGANIHTLLSHGFFMKDGLMGEFAKSKINEIIEFFNSNNNIYQHNKESLFKVINTIGEPFLKEKLLSMYNEKYPKTNEEKIVELEAEITRLKNGQNQI